MYNFNSKISGIGYSTNFSLESMMANKALKARYSSCASVHTLQRQGALAAHTACMTVTGAKVYDFLTPMHVWELDTPFGRITRRLYYDTEEILKPKPTYDELVPNIGTTFVSIFPIANEVAGMFS